MSDDLKLTPKARQDINEILHMAIGECVHEFKKSKRSKDIYVFVYCVKCGEGLDRSLLVQHSLEDTFYIPDYCSSLDAVAKAEKFVIEKFGIAAYGKHLYRIISDSYLHIPKWDEWANVESSIAVFATATAEQRARACMRTMLSVKE